MKNLLVAAFCFPVFCSAQTWDFAEHFSYAGEDCGYCIGTDTSGNIYVNENSMTYGGASGAGTGGDRIMKFDAAGNLLVRNNISGNGSSTIWDSIGNAYVCANALIKYSEDGTPVWNIPSTANHFYKQVTLTDNGPVISGFVSGGEPVLSAYDHTGTLLWQFGMTDYYATNECAVAAFHNEIFFTSTQPSGDTSLFFISHLDENGNFINKFLTPDHPISIVVNSSTITVLGFYANPITINDTTYTSAVGSYYLIQYDYAGNIIWYKVFSGLQHNGTIKEDKFGNIYVSTYFEGLHFDDVNEPGSGSAVVKFTNEGQKQWFMKVDNGTPPSFCIMVGMDLSPGGDVLVTGMMRGHEEFGSISLTQTSGAYSDMFIARITGNENVTAVKKHPPSLTTLNVSPNPGNGGFEISYENENVSKIKLNIYNSVGKLLQSELCVRPDNHFKKKIDLSAYSKGIYYVEVIADGNRSVEKIIMN